MNKANVSQSIDELGKIREQMKSLKENEEVILEKIKNEIAETGEYYGNEYTLLVSERVTSEIIPAKAFKTLKMETFLKVVKVVKEEAKKFLSLEQIDKISTEPQVSLVYKTNKTKK